MLRTRWAAAAVAALLGTVATADDVTTTAGKKLHGTLVAVDAQGITFATDTAKVPILARDIVVVDLGHPVMPPPKSATYSEIELTDGSAIRVAKFVLKGKKFEADPLSADTAKVGPVYDIPMGTVFSAMKRAGRTPNTARRGRRCSPAAASATCT